MIDRNEIQIELVKLAGDERLIRVSEANSGLTLEKKLDPKQPVVAQKEKLLRAFEAALARVELAPA